MMAALINLLESRGGSMYGGEAVTQLEHALQCANLAEIEGASPELVTAALLHDIGHLSACTGHSDHLAAHLAHESAGSRLLMEYFWLAVTEPVRLHVAAKRYLCAVDQRYFDGLSAASKRSLAVQGGVFSPTEAAEFIGQPYAAEAVRLRQWDDAAKVPGKRVPPLAHYAAIALLVARTDMRG